MAKVLGIEIIEFYEHYFPENTYHEWPDDETASRYMTEDNQWIIDPAQKYDLSDLGWICSDDGKDCKTFAYYFRAWMRKKTTQNIVIEVNKIDADRIKKELKRQGFKVL